MQSTGNVLYELKEKDVFFKNLKEKLVTDPGEKKWVGEGVPVYKWSEAYKNILRRHRFAMLDPNKWERKYDTINPERYYVHVYQTKIENQHNELKTLNSRMIAKHLRETWPDLYYPREIDIWKENIKRTKRSNVIWKENRFMTNTGLRTKPRDRETRDKQNRYIHKS